MGSKPFGENKNIQITATRVNQYTSKSYYQKVRWYDNFYINRQSPYFKKFMLLEKGVSELLCHASDRKQGV